jgi:hypothetical protein
MNVIYTKAPGSGLDDVFANIGNILAQKIMRNQAEKRQQDENTALVQYLSNTFGQVQKAGLMPIQPAGDQANAAYSSGLADTTQATGQANTVGDQTMQNATGTGGAQDTSLPSSVNLGASPDDSLMPTAPISAYATTPVDNSLPSSVNLGASPDDSLMPTAPISAYATTPVDNSIPSSVNLGATVPLMSTDQTTPIPAVTSDQYDALKNQYHTQNAVLQPLMGNVQSADAGLAAATNKATAANPWDNLIQFLGTHKVKNAAPFIQITAQQAEQQRQLDLANSQRQAFATVFGDKTLSAEDKIAALMRANISPDSPIIKELIAQSGRVIPNVPLGQGTILVDPSTGKIIAQGLPKTFAPKATPTGTWLPGADANGAFRINTTTGQRINDLKPPAPTPLQAWANDYEKKGEYITDQDTVDRAEAAAKNYSSKGPTDTYMNTVMSEKEKKDYFDASARLKNYQSQQGTGGGTNPQGNVDPNNLTPEQTQQVLQWKSQNVPNDEIKRRLGVQ